MRREDGMALRLGWRCYLEKAYIARGGGARSAFAGVGLHRSAGAESDASARSCSVPDRSRAVPKNVFRGAAPAEDEINLHIARAEQVEQHAGETAGGPRGQ